MWRSLTIAGLGLTLLSFNAAAQPGSPHPTRSDNAVDQQGADRYGQTDMYCRSSAASRSGYHGNDANSNVQQRYAAAYYACMSAENGAPPPNSYANGAPPNNYGSDGYAYGPPPPPNYYGDGPYGYPYSYAPYYAPYSGPAISFGFGFGGYGGGHHGGHGGGWHH